MSSQIPLATFCAFSLSPMGMSTAASKPSSSLTSRVSKLMGALPTNWGISHANKATTATIPAPIPIFFAFFTPHALACSDLSVIFSLALAIDSFTCSLVIDGDSFSWAGCTLSVNVSAFVISFLKAINTIPRAMTVYEMEAGPIVHLPVDEKPTEKKMATKPATSVTIEITLGLSRHLRTPAMNFSSRNAAMAI